MNPNTPVIVGVAHVEQRITDPLVGLEPTDLMVEAVRKAAPRVIYLELVVGE